MGLGVGGEEKKEPPSRRKETKTSFVEVFPQDDNVIQFTILDIFISITVRFLKLF